MQLPNRLVHVFHICSYMHGIIGYDSTGHYRMLIIRYAGKLYAHGRHVVIKTHGWSDQWDVKQAQHIYLTHRHLQGVVASYKRVGWAFNIPNSYVEEHQQWRVCCLMLLGIHYMPTLCDK